MVRDYELMYIVRPELDEEGLQAATASVEALVTGTGGSVVRSTSWGRRRLAYEVDHLRDGHYMLLHIRLEGARVAEVERALAIHDTVFRHLLVLHEAGAEVDTVDPDSAQAPAAAAAPAAEPEAPAEDEAPTDEAPAEAAPAEAAPKDEAPAGLAPRQAAVAADADDEPGDDGDEAEDDAAAVVAATEEEN